MTPRGSDDLIEHKIESLKKEISHDLQDIRADVNDKHAQNRKSIHELRGHVDEIMSKQSLQAERMAPFFGTSDTPGIIRELAADVKDIMTKQSQAQTAAATAAGAAEGAETTLKNTRGWIIAACSLGTLILGILIWLLSLKLR